LSGADKYIGDLSVKSPMVYVSQKKKNEFAANDLRSRLGTPCARINLTKNYNSEIKIARR
jgi:hypothetical protein